MTHTDIPGWFDFYAHYDRVLEAAPPLSTIVEVGVWHGRSVIYLAEQAKKRKLSIQIYAIDTFTGSTEHKADLAAQPPGYLLRQFNRNIRDCNAERLIYPIALPSLEAVKFFEDKSVFSVFIDAEHTYASVKADIAAWLPKIQPGGFIGGHDYTWDPATVARAVDEMLPARTADGSTWYQQL